MKYIDIHCHLDFEDYDKDREETFERMSERGVGAITIGTDLASSRRAVEIATAHENIWACIGIHPDETTPHPNPSPKGKGTQSEFNDSSLPFGEGRVGFNEPEFEKLVSNPKVVAIGECGLDYFRIKDEDDKIRQKKLFEQQIEFAIKHDKPLMLHCRNAYDECLEILESYKKEFGDKLRGNCHFFAGNIEQAKRFLDLGFTCSFTGVITFTRDYDEVIKFLPREMIMSETDAPFVAPVPHRGKRNEPVFVVEIVKKLAEIRGEEPETLSRSIVENASRMFKIVL